MYGVINAFSPFSVIYFVLIVILGGFFTVNLFLAVIFEEFLEAQQVPPLSSEARSRPQSHAAVWV